MRPALIYEDPTHCHNCGSDDVDIYDIYDRPINYKAMIKNFKIDEVLSFLKEERAPLAYMKCQKCNRIYIIDWSRGIPRPLLQETLASFKFTQGRKKSK